MKKCFEFPKKKDMQRKKMQKRLFCSLTGESLIFILVWLVVVGI